MSETEYDPLQVSQYNEAVAKLMRIGSLWTMAHSSAIQRNYYKWNAVLDEVWKELAADTEKEGTEESDIDNFNLSLSKLQPLYQIGSTGFNKQDKSSKDKMAKQYTILVKKEIYLRRLQNKLGMGTKYKDMYEDEIDM